MKRMDNKVAIVTGAASDKSIGFAIARAMAREGARVILTDVQANAVAERESELTSAGMDVLSVIHDVRDENQWESVISTALKRWGRLDVLVNNAGITFHDMVDELPIERWNQIIEINLTGTFLGCKHAIRAMRADKKGGSIVNISSIAGMRGFSGSVAYSASKGGIRQISKVVAIEGAADAIRCNSIMPGMILSDIHKQIVIDAPEHYQAILDSIPMRQMGEPDDIANCALYLASDEARYVTGAEFVIDGGSTSR